MKKPSMMFNAAKVRFPPNVDHTCPLSAFARQGHKEAGHKRSVLLCDSYFLLGNAQNQTSNVAKHAKCVRFRAVGQYFFTVD